MGLAICYYINFLCEKPAMLIFALDKGATVKLKNAHA